MNLPLYCTVMFDFIGENPDELTVHQGTIIKVLSQTEEEGWANCSIGEKAGIVPLSYLSKRVGRSSDELKEGSGGSGGVEVEKRHEMEETQAGADVKSEEGLEEERRMQEEKKSEEEKEKKRRKAAADADAVQVGSSEPSLTFSADKLPTDAVA